MKLIVYLGYYNPLNKQWVSIPLILCGGGKDYPVYVNAIMENYPRMLRTNYNFEGFN